MKIMLLSISRGLSSKEAPGPGAGGQLGADEFGLF